ncbi:MAG: MFS transporter [Bacteroidetes bacterium]|nr:MFS transporter [Bacteroidota bacterium]
MSTSIAKNRSIIIEEKAAETIFPILFMISFSHMLNDTIQSLIPSIYPIVKNSFQLNFAQVGYITFTFQTCACIFQPLVGLYTDYRPQPYSLAAGMFFSLAGLIILSIAGQFSILLIAVGLIGIGSSIFHPEASKVAFRASGSRRGLGQSIFQVGGNAGSALGPLLAALIVVHYGQSSILWFAVLPLLAIGVLINVGKWYSGKIGQFHSKSISHLTEKSTLNLSTGKITLSVIILIVLIFSKYFYLASMTSYYTFYLIDKFHISVRDAQLYLFIFLFSVSLGTFAGGPLGDRFGRKYVIWFSILGVAPFTLLLPHLNLLWTSIFTVFIGLILSSAFAAILVYAQELLPGKLGLISGLFYGLAFGMGGLGSAVLGALADKTSINHVYQLCAYLPLIGILTGFLPNINNRKKIETNLK